ncbi:hypothetical protein PR002_g30693 [Phytophthora rubi]|uniref:Uncharacterized protein n=2 Tax=Phytophthora rubi TaxID=129364 RepID=A0A6A3GN55_9STRA|nr:hypothetical protein PR002_g30693 [Phytophthora rubi]
MIGKQLWALSTLSSWEKLVVTRFACTLFAVLSVHFVLVALCLAIAQRGQTPLFGQWEEVSGAKLAAWAAVLFYCGVSGLVALVLKNERAAKQALGCWVLLLVLHTWYLNVAVSKSVWPTGAAPHERPHSWSTGKMMVQVLTDAMSSGFLVWLVRQRNANLVKEDFLQQPLLPITVEVSKTSTTSPEQPNSIPQP